MLKLSDLEGNELETYFCDGSGKHEAREIQLAEIFYQLLRMLDATVCPQCGKILKIRRGLKK